MNVTEDLVDAPVGRECVVELCPGLAVAVDLDIEACEAWVELHLDRRGRRDDEGRGATCIPQPRERRKDRGS